MKYYIFISYTIKNTKANHIDKMTARRTDQLLLPCVLFLLVSTKFGKDDLWYYHIEQPSKQYYIIHLNMGEALVCLKSCKIMLLGISCRHNKFDFITYFVSEENQA